MCSEYVNFEYSRSIVSALKNASIDAEQVLYFEQRQLQLQLPSRECESVNSLFHDYFVRNEVKLKGYG